MKNLNKRDQKSIIKNLAGRQLGINSTKSLSYYKTLSILENLKPTVGLENNPDVGEFNNQIAEIQFNPKGNLVASVLWGNDKVHVWNLSTKKIQAFFESGHGFTVRQVRWVPDRENLVLTSGDSGIIRLMDLNTKESIILERFSENSSFYSKSLKMCVHKSSPFTILAGSVTGGVINIDLRTSKSTEILRVFDNDLSSYQIDSLDINPVKYSEFCMGSGKDARVYDSRFLSTPVQKLQIKYLDENASMRCSNVYVEYSYDGSEIIVAYSEAPVYLFTVNDSQPKKIYVTEKASHDKRSRFTMYNAHYVGSRSEFIAASTTVFKGHKKSQELQHTLFIWDKESEELINEIHISHEPSWRFAVHPYMPLLAFNMENGVRLWE